ncbi:MAG: rRNA maturation RNase YbeY [Candidatus Moraniibacteriota bacterium]
MNIEIVNEIEEKEVGFFVRETLEKGVDFLVEKGILSKETEIELSVAFLKKEEIRLLNKQYREKNYFTDILSFCYAKNSQRLEGEIILCSEAIRENAYQDKKPFLEELAEVVFHGFLHIYGYNHGKEMFSLQKDFLSNYCRFS